MKLEREAADGTAVLAFRVDDRAAVLRQQREDLFDGILDVRPGRFQQHRADAVAIGFQHRQKHVLLARKEVIEAAAVDPLRLRMSAIDVEAYPLSQNSSIAASTMRQRVSLPPMTQI